LVSLRTPRRRLRFAGAECGLRLCGQRAARQAALASQQRRPVVRRKSKKYRGPTRTPPAKRNDKPQEEEFGRHMRKWLEGEQVPLMPTE